MCKEKHRSSKKNELHGFFANIRNKPKGDVTGERKKEKSTVSNISPKSLEEEGESEKRRSNAIVRDLCLPNCVTCIEKGKNPEKRRGRHSREKKLKRGKKSKEKKITKKVASVATAHRRASSNPAKKGGASNHDEGGQAGKSICKEYKKKKRSF